MILVITGPTALGKSKTAINIAKQINAEIINGDAYQAYKELNIGVAKPSVDDLGILPHHLYSFVEPTHNYSIAEYQKTLRNKIDEILSKNKNVIIVGGSGLYIRSALYDYEFAQETQVDMSKYESLTDEELHFELEKIDPVEASKIHMNNRKRVLRAIQIYLAEGKPKSEIIAEQEHKPLYDVKFFVRDLDRDELYNRINLRVDQMFDCGLLEEVQSLFKKYDVNLQCFQAIGYKEFVPYFEGKASLEETKELIKKNTRNYAKRQMTFIRHQFDVCFYKEDEDILKEISND